MLTYDDLVAAVADMTPEQLEPFAAQLEPADLALLEQAVGDLGATHWRADPARMANHLTNGERQLWPYVLLLSRQFVHAIDRTDPRQQWWVPSQYGKTTGLKDGVVWALDRNPRLRFMYLSYDANKAKEEAGDVRDFVELHQDVLRFRLRPDRRARGRWQTDQGGGLYATGIKGGITGYPADVVLLDDLLKGWQAAHSETERNTVWNVYISQVRMRLQALDCAVVSVGTRWHEDDPQARMLAQAVPGETWHVTRLPALAEAPDPDNVDPILRLPDPLGREPGQPLEERRFPLAEVLARQAVLGTYLAGALEQQRPSPEAGTEILREWFQLEATLPTVPDEAISSWDMKMKDKQVGDYVVGQVWWRVGGGYWLMDQLRGVWNVATTKAAMALCVVRHPEVALHYYENTGNAPELTGELRRGDPDYVLRAEVADQLAMTPTERQAVQALLRRGMQSLLPVTPEGDKRVRMRAVSPVIEGRNVHLPADQAFAPWVPLYLQEMAAFPNATHDDQVDATSQALAKLARGEASLTPAGAGTRVPSTLPTGRTQSVPASILTPRRRG